MGSFHDDLVHGAGLIMIAHAYYDFFAEKKASEENMIKMAKVHEVLDSDITADPLPLSDEDYLAIFENAWK